MGGSILPNLSNVFPADASQQPQQQPAQQPIPDQASAGLDAADQFYRQQLQANTPSPQTGGPVRRVLQNFFSGMGNSMMREAGLPTQYDLQQRALQGIQNTANARGMLALHQAYAQQVTPSVPMIGLDGRPIIDPSTSQVMRLPPSHAAQFYSALQGSQARTQAAGIGAQAKMGVAEFQVMAAAGQVSRLVPVQDENGQMVMRAINKYGQPIGDIQGAIPPASYLGKISSTQDWKQLEDGSYAAFPKTTVTRPNIPGAPGGTPTPAQTGGGGVRAVGGIATLNGQPLIGKGGITSTTKTMVETAPKVEDLANRLLGHINNLEQSGDLGPGMSRWNEFWSGKVGTDNPEFRKMMTDSSLLSTLLMRMHTGARGAVQMMQHFDNILGSGHQSPANMRAAIDEILQYAKDVKGASPLPPGFGGFNKPPAASPNAPSAPAGADPFAQFGGKRR